MVLSRVAMLPYEIKAIVVIHHIGILPNFNRAYKTITHLLPYSMLVVVIVKMGIGEVCVSRKVGSMGEEKIDNGRRVLMG